MEFGTACRALNLWRVTDPKSFFQGGFVYDRHIQGEYIITEYFQGAREARKSVEVLEGWVKNAKS